MDEALKHYAKWGTSDKKDTYCIHMTPFTQNVHKGRYTYKEKNI